MNLIFLDSLSAKKNFLEIFLNFQSLLNVLKLLALSFHKVNNMRPVSMSCK